MRDVMVVLGPHVCWIDLLALDARLYWLYCLRVPKVKTRSQNDLLVSAKAQLVLQSVPYISQVEYDMLRATYRQ